MLQSESAPSGRDSGSEHYQSVSDGVEEEDASYDYHSHSRGHSSRFKPAAPFGIQPRGGVPFSSGRHYVKTPLMAPNLTKEEDDDDDFDRQLSRERQRQMEMSHRGRGRDEYSSRHDDYRYGDNDNYTYGRENEDDYRGYRGDYGRSRHGYDRDLEGEPEASWSHGRDHSEKETPRFRGTGLPSLLSSSRRPDVAVAAAEVSAVQEEALCLL